MVAWLIRVDVSQMWGRLKRSVLVGKGTVRLVVVFGDSPLEAVEAAIV